MKMWKVLLPVTAAVLFSGPAFAQSEEAAEVDRAAAEAKREEMESQKAKYSERLREAEESMEAAARRVAEISRENLPQWEVIERRIEMSNKPRLGITIDGNDESGEVKGVQIIGVSPESAADDAGLRADDVITAINGESLGAENSMKANKLLLDIMQGVKEDDELKVDYLRNGNTGSVELTPRVVEMHSFSWAPEDGNVHIERMPSVPGMVREFKFGGGIHFGGGAWGRMELVELTEGLGRYFGTDKGLLIVSAPEADGIDLQDGDVLQSIDGREPKDVRHAMRILGSYDSGETIKLSIMRDKKKRTLEVEVPDDRRGSRFVPLPSKPARIPAPPKPAPDTAST